MGRARVRTQYIIISYYYFLITHNNNTQNVYTNTHTHTNALRLKIDDRILLCDAYLITLSIIYYNSETQQNKPYDTQVRLLTTVVFRRRIGSFTYRMVL